MMHLRLCCPLLSCVMLFGGTAAGDIVWDEAQDGDFSENYLEPSQVLLSTGSNRILFTSNDLPGDPDREYFTFTIEAGYQLSNFILDEYITTPEENLGFIGIASGSQFPSPPSSLSPAPLLGYSLMGLADVGTDLLPAMGQAPGALGFVGPLGAGSYTVWAQETSLSIDQWGLDLVVTAVPAPGALAVIGLGGIVFRRRRG